jgi:hypothetical protein
MFEFSSPSSDNRGRLPPSSRPYTSTNNQDPKNSNQIRLEKVGPSYNKRVVTPEQELLSAAVPPEFGKFGNGWREREVETKVWINPRFGKEGEVIEGKEVELDRHHSQITQSSGIWFEAV